MSMLVDRAQAALEAALDGLSQRQQLIAGNLANIDTPGYSPSSLDFESALRRELDGAGLSTAGTATGTLAMAGPAVGPSAAAGLRVIGGAGMAGAAPGAMDPQVASQVFAGSTRNDANTVDVESEITALSEAQLKYSAVSRLVTGKLGMLKSVAGGR